VSAIEAVQAAVEELPAVPRPERLEATVRGEREPLAAGRPAPLLPPIPPQASSYRPRRPTATPLYPVVQHHLETFLAEAEESDPSGFAIPAWVERDFRGYLRFGIPAHGFARARCEVRFPVRKFTRKFHPIKARAA